MKKMTNESLGAVHTGSLKENKKKNIKGITLVALVVTIIILLILAGISITALTQTGIFGKAKISKEKSENAQKEEYTILGDYEETINKTIVGNRDTVTLTSDEYNNILKRLENLENKTNDNFNSEPVLNVKKTNTTTGNNTIWFTDSGSYMTREYNDRYFSYDYTDGFTVKKEGWFLICMNGHISSAGNGGVRLNAKINDEEYCLNGRWNTSSNTGEIHGWLPIYLKEGDKVNGNFLTKVNGANHYFDCQIYAFN